MKAKKQQRLVLDSFRERESGRGFRTNWKLMKEQHPELFK